MADNESSGDAGAVVDAPSNGQVQTGNGNGQVEQQQQQEPRPNTWSIIKTLVIRMLFIYFLASIFRRSPTPSQPTSPDGMPVRPPSNLFPKGQRMDMYVYVSEQETFSDFNDSEALFWLHKYLEYGNWEDGPDQDGKFYMDREIAISPRVQNNGSLYIHVYFVKSGNSPNPKDKGKYSRKGTAYKSKRLNRFKKRYFHTTVNLLTGQTDADPSLVKRENSSAFEVLSHWHPNLTINLLDDHSPWTQGHVPAPLDEHVEFLPGTNDYFPVVYLNDYWNLNKDYQPINDSLKALNLSLTYSPISLLRWQMYAAQGMRNKWYDMLGANMAEESEDDQDSLKTAFLETNPYLLGLTIIVSILHSIFEFLAFKNDIQFWKSRKSLEGLSVRSVFFNVFQSLVVVLYVLDHETNFVVQISVCIGLVIEIWKIHKVVNVELDRENRLFGCIPRPRISHKSSYTDSHTREYDMQAFKYLAYLLYPLLAVYAVYSLVYMEHKGWYSWVLSMLYGFLLTFGFIMMTPQLFINYKLKSVAHLPWRMLTYKALNTFIDDIFAFVIKMPTLYRIGCLRDDVIFFIYLYQRYIYRVDPKRVNEFGTSQEMLEQNGVPAVEGETRGAEGEGADSSAVKSADDKKKD